MKYVLMTLMSIFVLGVTGCGDKDEDTAAEDTAVLDASGDTGDAGSDTGDGGSSDE